MSPRLITAFVLTLGLSTAQASTVNTGQVGINPNFSGGTGPFSQNVNNQGPVDIKNPQLVTGGFGSSGNAATFVDYGVIKLSGDSAGSLNAVARGIIRDDLTFSAPGFATGTQAAVTFSLIVNGTLSVGPLGLSTASWGLQADLGGGFFDINKSASLLGAGPFLPNHGYVGDPFGTYSATVTLQLGFVAPLDIELTASAQTGFDFVGSSPSSFDLAHSLYWGGIGAVTINGVAVNDFAVTSGSGTAYSTSLAPAPVPLPPALLLFAPALALLRHRCAPGLRAS